LRDTDKYMYNIKHYCVLLDMLDTHIDCLRLRGIFILGKREIFINGQLITWEQLNYDLPNKHLMNFPPKHIGFFPFINGGSPSMLFECNPTPVTVILLLKHSRLIKAKSETLLSCEIDNISQDHKHEHGHGHRSQSF